MAKMNFTFLLALVLWSCESRNQKQFTDKPNLIYILTDQWRASDTGYAGNAQVKTPNLDQFAKEAINFSNAVSVTPVCTPHRAALMTGKYPTSTGMFVNDIYLPSEEYCMAEIFRDAGYQTAYYGKWHLDGHGRLNNVEPERRQGFDYWKAVECSHDYNKMPYYENDDPELKYWTGYSPFAIVEDANRYLEAHANDESPMLLFLSIATPHFPHGSAPDEYQAMYPSEGLDLPVNIADEHLETARKELQGYYAHITATDVAIGKVINKLKELGIWNNSIIVFSSDHGEMMGAHGIRPKLKQMAWDESLRVPFLIRYPDMQDNEGLVVNAPINTPDILPSLLSLAGIQIPVSIEGEDLSLLMRQPDPLVDRAALVMNICPFTSNYSDDEFRAIRTRQYTYLRTLKGPAQLFDNLNDPHQLNNLINTDENRELQEELDQMLMAELMRIHDNFQPRQFYLNKFSLVLDEDYHAIQFRNWDEGKGQVQSPTVR